MKTSADIIHDRFEFVSTSGKSFNKKDFLKGIQRYKNILRERQIKTVGIGDLVSFDSICLFLASLEIGTAIYGLSMKFKDLTAISGSLDAIITTYSVLIERLNVCNIPHIHLTIENDSILDEYIPEEIDFQKIALTSFTSGSSGKEKTVYHTAKSVIDSGLVASEQFKIGEGYSSFPTVSHIGVMTFHVLGPIIAGVKFYSLSEISDIVHLVKKKALSSVSIFSAQFSIIKELHGDVDFSNIRVYLGGSSPVQGVVDYFFKNNGEKMFNVFGLTECLPPIFIHEIDVNYDFSKNVLGKLQTGYEFKIDEDSVLLVKGPGLSSYVDIDSNGFFYTKDFAEMTETNDVIYLGRGSIVNQDGRRIFEKHVINEFSKFGYSKPVWVFEIDGKFQVVTEPHLYTEVLKLKEKVESSLKLSLVIDSNKTWDQHEFKPVVNRD
jgi:long-subunit acyl-CoA synthetase (AMP-forming)